MFCSKCGAKINKDDKFCKKCGETLPGEKKEESSAKKSVTEKPAVTQSAPAKKKNVFSVCCGILLIVIFVPLIIDISYKNSFSATILPLILIILAIFFLVCLVVGLIRAIIKKKTSTAITYGILILVLLGIGYGVYRYYINKQTATYNNIQDAFSSALSAQYLGDDIVAGKADADFTVVKSQTAFANDALSKITPPSDLKDYYNAIYTWSGKLNDSAVSKKTWKNRPDAPTTFGAQVKGTNGSNYFQDSLNRIVLAKEYGDLAIKNNDKGTMRYISAELLAEDISLGNISISYNSNEKKSIANNFIQIAYAAKTNSLRNPRGRCPDFGKCKPDVKKKIPPTYQTAHRYSVGDPAAATDWNNAWKDMLNTISIDNGYNISGAGASNGANQNYVSPMQQAFTDECTAKGGTVGSGGVKDRLPTTLSGGWNCNYPHGGQTCWDYLTTSGTRFMGGNSSCPEMNLLPKITPNTNNNGGGGGGNGGNGNNNTSTHDGTYNVQYSSASCNLGTSLGYGQMFQAAGVSDKIIVKNNRVVNFDGTTSAISSSGAASFTWNYNTGSGVFKMTQTFNFSGNNVTGKVSFVLNVSTEGGTGNVSCSETFSGSK